MSRFICPVRNCEAPFEAADGLYAHTLNTHKPTGFDSLLRFIHGTRYLEPRKLTGYQRSMVQLGLVEVVYDIGPDPVVEDVGSATEGALNHALRCLWSQGHTSL